MFKLYIILANNSDLSVSKMTAVRPFGRLTGKVCFYIHLDHKRIACAYPKVPLRKLKDSRLRRHICG